MKNEARLRTDIALALMSPDLMTDPVARLIRLAFSRTADASDLKYATTAHCRSAVAALLRAKNTLQRNRQPTRAAELGAAIRRIEMLNTVMRGKTSGR